MKPNIKGKDAPYKNRDWFLSKQKEGMYFSKMVSLFNVERNNIAKCKINYGVKLARKPSREIYTGNETFFDNKEILNTCNSLGEIENL